jgi:hypothetical protein
MRLSEHFERAEFERTATGLPNSIPSGLVLNARDLCVHVLEPIRARFGPVILHSGYRSDAVNRAVGSTPASQHRRAEAADLEAPGHPNLLVAAWIRDHLDFDQLILEGHRAADPASGWVHVSWTRRHAPRRSVLTMTPGAHGPVYTPGLPRLAA